MAFVAEVKAKLGLDTSQFSSALTSTTAQFGKAAGKMEKLADKKLGFAGLMKGVAMGSGFFGVEKAIEKLSRFFSGMSEEAEKTFATLDELSAKNTEDTIANMRKLASEETQYQLLLKDRTRALERPTEGFSPTKPGILEKGAGMLAGPLSFFSPMMGAAVGAYGNKLGTNRGKDNAAEELKAREENKAKAIKADAELAEMDKKRVEKYIKETEEISKSEEELQKLILDGEREQMSIAAKVIDLKQESDALAKATYKTELESLEAAKKIVKNKADIVKLEKDAAEAAKKATKTRQDAEDDATDARRDYGADIENASGFTLGEVAAGGKGILQSQKAKAKRVQLMEARARQARARGNKGEANILTTQANKLREGISSLTDSERDPMAAKEKAIREADSKVDKAKAAEKRADDIAKDTKSIAENTKATAKALGAVDPEE